MLIKCVKVIYSSTSLLIYLFNIQYIIIADVGEIRKKGGNVITKKN